MPNPRPKPFSEYHRPVDYRNTWQIFRLMAELVEGYQFLAPLKNEVTIFGSARFPSTSLYYKEAEKLGRFLAKNKNTVITGGGPGVMEAANKGAYEAGGESIGLSIHLPDEQLSNKYVRQNLSFSFFVTRKVMLTSPSQAYVFFPGGYGTMDELFEVLNYIELGAIERVPVILVGKEFWQPLIDFLKDCSYQKAGSVGEKEMSFVTLVDSAEEAFSLIRRTKEKVFLSDLDPNQILYRGGERTDWRVFRIMAELVEGFEFLTSYVQNAITILGSKSIKNDSPYYQLAYRLAKELGRRQYMIITGGGAGIMEAANKGAYETGAESFGLSMRLDRGFRLNPYVKKSISFSFSFIRKLILTTPSRAFIFFPGGFGTLHQLFEILTLLKTRKRREVPVLLCNQDFWQPLANFIRRKIIHEQKAATVAEFNLLQIVNTEKDVLELLR